MNMRVVWEAAEKALRTVVSVPFRLAGKRLGDETWEKLLQFLKFCMVGVSNTVVSLGVYYIFVLINKNWYIAGNAVGFVASVLNSYFWNSRYVFGKTDEVAKTMVKTFAAYGTNLIIGTALLYLFVDVLHISEFAAPLLNLIITIPLNFILNKLWVMK